MNKKIKLLFSLALTIFATSSPQAYAGTKVKVALIGDSTVEDAFPGARYTGWGRYFAANMNQEKVEVVNFAIGGRSTKTFIKEGHFQKVMSYAPNYVLIDLGINDSNRTIRRIRVNPKGYANLLNLMITQIQSIGGQVILVTPHAFNQFNQDGEYIEKNLQPYRDMMRKVASFRGVVLLDLYNRTLPHFAAMTPEQRKKRFVGPVHLTPTGASELGYFVASELRQSWSPLRLDVKAGIK